jgi:hypothetical protein
MGSIPLYQNNRNPGDSLPLGIRKIASAADGNKIIFMSIKHQAGFQRSEKMYVPLKMANIRKTQSDIARETYKLLCQEFLSQQTSNPSEMRILTGAADVFRPSQGYPHAIVQPLIPASQIRSSPAWRCRGCARRITR